MTFLKLSHLLHVERKHEMLGGSIMEALKTQYRANQSEIAIYFLLMWIDSSSEFEKSRFS